MLANLLGGGRLCRRLAALRRLDLRGRGHRPNGVGREGIVGRVGKRMTRDGKASGMVVFMGGGLAAFPLSGHSLTSHVNWAFDRSSSFQLMHFDAYVLLSGRRSALTASTLLGSTRQ